MYKRNRKKPPTKIERDVFVTEILELGFHEHLSPNTIINAVIIADRYVDDCQKFYSLELAHTTTVIACKYLEDWGSYDSMYVASDELENRVIYDIELEICYLYKFCFPIDNVLTLLMQPVINEIMTSKRCLGADFYVLTEKICRDKTLLTANPMTILLALKLLNKLTKNEVLTS